jgi:hypothetical protein
MRDFIMRGILIGGACGVFGALLGFSDSLGRAFGMGMIGGALAGYTLSRLRR